MEEEGLKSEESEKEVTVAKQKRIQSNHALTIINYSCIQILYKLEEILQFIIITHTISENNLCRPTPAGGDAGGVNAPATGTGTNTGQFGRLESSFPHAHPLKSITNVFIIIIIYCNYLNLYRHRKSLRRKQSKYLNTYATGVCC